MKHTNLILYTRFKCLITYHTRYITVCKINRIILDSKLGITWGINGMFCNYQLTINDTLLNAIRSTTCNTIFCMDALRSRAYCKFPHGRGLLLSTTWWKMTELDNSSAIAWLLLASQCLGRGSHCTVKREQDSTCKCNF